MVAASQVNGLCGKGNDVTANVFSGFCPAFSCFLPFLGRCPGFLFLPPLFSLLPSPSSRFFEAILFLLFPPQSLELKSIQGTQQYHSHGNTGLLRFSFCIKSRKCWKGRARVEGGMEPDWPHRGWCRVGEHRSKLGRKLVRPAGDWETLMCELPRSDFKHGSGF